MFSSFFLGANSGKGFYSLYDELIDLETANAVYILKGCPGCGKSSLMKKVANAAEEKGLKVERIFCSSDPDSLDGIIIPLLNTAIVDGTAPHVVEPKYPLAVERYTDLSQFADFNSLSLQKEKIILTKRHYSDFFNHIYRFTSCAAHIDNELFDIAVGGVSLDKISKRAKGIITRELGSSGHNGKLKRRFASGITPKGYICSFNITANEFAQTYVIEDNFGLSHFLLLPILQHAKEKGIDTIACYNALIPERLEHIIFPELSLAFITSSDVLPYNNTYQRKIRLDSKIDKNVLQQKKHRISFLKKTRSTMLHSACELLSEAKKIHDDLENIYNPYIDFDSLYSFADALIWEILK